jgi:copper homeostasis protein
VIDFTLEIPIDSLEVAVAAAPMLIARDRFELCDDLASEGWTPKMDLVRAVRGQTPSEIEVVAMIRPRDTDVPPTLEIEAAAAAGANSVAIGLLSAAGGVHLDACARLVETARSCGLSVAFLRTFDLLVDREAGMRAVHELGCLRVVTAGVLGWDASVADLPARLAALAADRGVAEACASDEVSPVEIVPGGGVRASNATSFAAVSPHLHASCRRNGVFSLEELDALISLRRA